MYTYIYIHVCKANPTGPWKTKSGRSCSVAARVRSRESGGRQFAERNPSFVWGGKPAKYHDVDPCGCLTSSYEYVYIYIDKYTFMFSAEDSKPSPL